MIFRTLSSSDADSFPAGVELLNRTQGRDLFAADYLKEKTSQSNALVVGAFDEHGVAAVGVSELLTNFDYYLPFDPELATELAEKVVGSFSTLCVRESLQGTGVGQKLSRMRLDWLFKHRCEVVLGVSWVSGLAHTSNRVFEKMGFQPVRRVEHFYRETSLKTPFDCPGCRKAPCACAAILYRLEVQGVGQVVGKPL